MPDPLLRLNSKSGSPFSSAPSRHPIPLVSAPLCPPQPVSKGCLYSSKVPPLSLHLPNLSHWGGLPQDPHPASPCQPQVKRWMEGSRSQHFIQGLWGLDIETRPAERLHASLGQGLCNTGRFTVVLSLQRLKTPRGLSSWCSPTGCEPRPHLIKCRGVHLS